MQYASNSRSGEVSLQFLGEGMTRSGEMSSPMRDCVMLPLFHARSEEMIQLRRD